MYKSMSSCRMSTMLGCFPSGGCGGGNGGDGGGAGGDGDGDGGGEGAGGFQGTLLPEMRPLPLTKVGSGATEHWSPCFTPLSCQVHALQVVFVLQAAGYCAGDGLSVVVSVLHRCLGEGGGGKRTRGREKEKYITYCNIHQLMSAQQYTCTAFKAHSNGV